MTDGFTKQHREEQNALFFPPRPAKPGTGRRGIFIVLSAPSGGGKTTIYKAVLNQLAGISYSVSYTTRTPREGEITGQDYHFVDLATFERMKASGEFIEWAEVHGAFYGTHRKTLQRTLEAGQDIILDIDVQGARLLRRKMSDGVFIFIFPPSIKVLEARLRDRKSDSDEIIHRRLEIAQREMESWPDYDYLVVNDNLDKAILEVLSIIRAERCSVMRLHPAWVETYYRLSAETADGSRSEK
jgi:guanylate kinase